MDDLVGFISPARWVGHPTLVYAELASTNDEARKHAENGCPQGLMVLADAQSAGRGRRGRAWVSPAGENLYLSLVARPTVALARVPTMALVVGLAVCEAVSKFVGTEAVSVKWPNDVRVREKKLSGVLVEGAIRGASLSYAIVGVGVNVRGARVAEELSETATTLRMACGREVSRREVLEALSRSLESRLDALSRDGFGALLGALKSRCETLGRAVKIEGVEGVAEDIADDGALVVRTRDGALVACHAGDVG